jgi:hypothetical protein
MKKLLISIFVVLSLALSCDNSSDQCVCDCYGIFVIDSLVASSEIDTCRNGIDGVFNKVRIIYHFEILNGVMVEACLSIKDTGWGTACVACMMPDCLDMVKPKNEMFELTISNSGCPRETEEESLEFILNIKSVFWRDEASIVDTGIQYYNNYVWTDTISVTVKR